ncbi:MAG: hypothetical protein P8X86_03230 [Desulfofustis sp.]|jgi:hypothetical protein
MNIHPDTIQKLSDLWVTCTVDVQSTLIKKYLDQLSSGSAGDWAEYLADEFCASKLTHESLLFKQ